MYVRIHKNTAKVDCRWAIGLLFAEGIAYVTRIENYPEKCFYWESVSVSIWDTGWNMT